MLVEMHHWMCSILHVPDEMHHYIRSILHLPDITLCPKKCIIALCSILHVPEEMHHCMCSILHVPEEMHHRIMPKTVLCPKFA